MADTRKANSAKGGKIGGPKSPTNFKNNRTLAAMAGAKSKRGPALTTCEWCGDRVPKNDWAAHAKLEHPKLLAKHPEQEEVQKNGIG